jgi:lactate dehydrogenase-like 2-hydroxyacid dehydrogenase
MKENAILVNSSRGALIAEEALVAHCGAHPNFRCGLDVSEREPETCSGLTDLSNIVSVLNIGSATSWTREGMASLAARNAAALLNGWAVWGGPETAPFLGPP